MASDTPRFRRPAMLDPQQADELVGGPDPAVTSEIAHLSAAAIVHRVREADDPEAVQRLVRLVETEGLDVVAALWSQMPTTTLPGALWALYELQDGVRSQPEAVARWYRKGSGPAEVSEAIAGVAEAPGPKDVLTLVDSVLSGVFSGDLATTLERAAAFCRVLAAGAAFEADEVDLDGGTVAAPAHQDAADKLTRGARGLLGTAEALEQDAKLWRAGRLD